MSVIAFKKKLNPSLAGGEVEDSRLITSSQEAPQHSDDGGDLGLRRPIILGTSIVAVFIVGLGIWASFAPLSGAVIASGVVKVEDSRKVVKHRDGGIVARVLVRDGQHVKEGEPLLRMDDVQVRATFDVYDNQLMNLRARRARLVAESNNAGSIKFPPDILNRKDEPAVAQLIADQNVLFRSRRLAEQAQFDILTQRVQQLNTRVDGYEAQIGSIVRQQELIEEEKGGVATLLKKGLARKTQVLALERASVDLGGQTGSLRSQIAEAREAQGEAMMQISRLQQERLSEANQGLSDVQSELANIVPRLAAAKATLALADVSAPATGIVLGLTQFTNGGVVSAGERILDIVPDGAKLVIEAMVQPQDVTKLQPDMKAMVKLTAYNQRVTPSVEGKIMQISADRLTREDGTAYFAAEVAIDPSTLTHLAHDIRLYPGMSAEVIVPTGERTAMDYILGPISNSLDRAFREE